MAERERAGIIMNKNIQVLRSCHSGNIQAQLVELIIPPAIILNIQGNSAADVGREKTVAELVTSVMVTGTPVERVKRPSQSQVPQNKAAH